MVMLCVCMLWKTGSTVLQVISVQFKEKCYCVMVAKSLNFFLQNILVQEELKMYFTSSFKRGTPSLIGPFK